jgi:hypothetical protein
LFARTALNNVREFLVLSQRAMIYESLGTFRTFHMHFDVFGFFLLSTARFREAAIIWSSAAIVDESLVATDFPFQCCKSLVLLHDQVLYSTGSPTLKAST